MGSEDDRDEKWHLARPRVGAEVAAGRAPKPRPERRHGHVVAAPIHVDDRAVRFNHPHRDLARSIGVCPACPPTP
jgi:hypothetical protein